MPYLCKEEEVNKGQGLEQNGIHSQIKKLKSEKITER